MTVSLVFQVSDGFEHDELVWKVSKKLWNNYKFRHIMRGKYLLTPDLTNLLVKPYSLYGKDEYLLLYLLSLYKYGVMKGYLKFIKAHINTDNPLFKDSLRTLINFVLNKEKMHEVRVSLGYTYTSKTLTSVVMEVYEPINHNQLYNKKLLIINLDELVNDEFDERKPPVEYLLETPLSKIRRVFDLEVTGEYYTARNGEVIKVFELDENQLNIQGSIESNMMRPPALPLLNQYLGTGKLLNVTGCTPQEELIRNFNSIILGKNLGCIHSMLEGKNYIHGKLSKYNEVKLNIGEELIFDESILKEYYPLLKNLVSVNEWFAERLYNAGVKSVSDFFNPPVDVIKSLLSDAVLNVVRAKGDAKFNVRLVWRSVKNGKCEVPFLIILKVDVKVKTLMGHWSDQRGYYVVFNNMFYSNSLNTKFFKIRDIGGARDVIFNHISQTVSGGKLEATIV